MSFIEEIRFMQFFKKGFNIFLIYNFNLLSYLVSLENRKIFVINF